jgi:cytochrome b561
MTQSYSSGAKLLHWLTALAIFCALPLGISMLRVEPGPLQNQLFDLHRSFGALILALAAVRLLWRLFVPPPPLVPGLPRWQELAAVGTHWALYVLIFAVPLVGWAGTSAFGAAITVFGLFQLPMILDKNKELAEVLLDVHVGLVITLSVLVVMHIGAALHHHFVRKDATLLRMLPGSKGGENVPVTDR